MNLWRCLANVALGLFLGMQARPAKAKHAAEILWDTYGVPHVYGQSAEDMFYGFGWAQMKSHGNLLLRLYAEGRGRAAEYFGADERDSDRWMAINDVPARGQAWLAAQPPEFRAKLEAFAEGMNAYGAAHPEALAEAARRVLPVSAVDVVTYAHRLFQYVYLAPAKTAANLPDEAKSAGSNGWAIAPKRSASGHTMMLMNPHLPWATGWSTYYEAHLNASGLNLYGATQVGLPVLRFVFSDQLGITNTVDQTNGVTFYKIVADGNSYRFDGTMRPFSTRTVVLKIRKTGGGFDTETVQVRATVQGPVVGEHNGAPVAMRVAGLERPLALYEYWKMETARSFSDYQAALRMLQVPTFNIIYGDRDGHIEYLFNGLVPRHPFGDLAYWTSLVPGDTSRTLWTDYLSYDELPKAIDPAGGSVQNSNDPPWNTAFPAIIDPKPYAPYISADAVNLRMARGIRMLGAADRISFDQLLDERWSTVAELPDRVLPALKQAVQATDDNAARQALDVVLKWDRKTDPDSRGALLFLAWTEKMKLSGYKPDGFAVPCKLGDPLHTPFGLSDPQAAVVALHAAAAALRKSGLALDAPWGSVMRLKWAGANVPGRGGPGALGIFNVIQYAPPDAAGDHAAIFGSSFVAVISFDRPTHSKVLLSYGNSSQPGSKHAADQIPLVSAGKMRDAWRTRKEVEAHLEDRESF